MHRHELGFGLHSAVRLRHESFGGIAYHRGSGGLLELDDEAFALMVALGAAPQSTIRDLARRLRVPPPVVAHFLAELVDREFVCENEGTRVKPFGSAIVDRLSAPITLHWALTYACNYSCPHCYALTPGTPGELTLDQKLEAVRRIAEWGVLEVAIGGGEPTVSRDLEAVLLTIRNHDMVPSLTSNGSIIDERRAKLLAETCGVVQLSLDRPEILDRYRGSGAARRALAALHRLQSAGARAGVNLLLVPENMRDIAASLDWLVEQGVRRIVLLRPFGQAWPQGWPDVGDWLELRRGLGDWTMKGPQATLEVACGMAFVLSDLPWEERRRRLAFGCSGARRFLSMRASGTLWPCSHLEAHPLGHVLRDDLAELWRTAWQGPPPEQLACPAADYSPSQRR